MKASQVIEDFPDDDADFDESDLMQIDDVTTQEMEKEKENRYDETRDPKRAGTVDRIQRTE